MLAAPLVDLAQNLARIIGNVIATQPALAAGGGHLADGGGRAADGARVSVMLGRSGA